MNTLPMVKKRKLNSDSDSAEGHIKRPRMSPATPANDTTVITEFATPTDSRTANPQPEPHPAGSTMDRMDSGVETSRLKSRRNKLVPPRPYPKVPVSSSATGPPSAQKEGKNYICITRKTPLGAYMRRCKDLVVQDGYKTIHFSAMGAAIPHLLQLALALPPILPFSTDEIKTEVTTGTVEVQDEIVPEDEDEDISYEIRGKSNLRIVFKIGDGEREGSRGLGKKKARKTANKGGEPSKRNHAARKGGTKTDGAKPTDLIYEEPEQEADMI